MGEATIRTPDQRLRVFVSSTLGELAEERAAVREAIEHLHLTPVMFELGARACVKFIWPRGDGLIWPRLCVEGARRCAAGLAMMSCRLGRWCRRGRGRTGRRGRLRSARGRSGRARRPRSPGPTRRWEVAAGDGVAHGVVSALLILVRLARACASR